MEITKKEIVICLGSSCFARGNKKLLKIINDYLKDRNIVNDVYFHGQRCFGKCAVGPSLRFDNQLIEHLDEETIIAKLDEFFIDLL